MRLFDWFRRKPPAPSIDDPVFGKLTRHNEELWVGSCVIERNPAREPVQVLLHALEGRPSTEQSETFRMLCENYRGLRSAISRELFELCQSYADFFQDEKVPGNPEAPEEFIALTTLECIDVQSDGTLRLLYGFSQADIWDDAVMNILVKDGKPEWDCIDT
jgi:hypothetical protein